MLFGDFLRTGVTSRARLLTIKGLYPRLDGACRSELAREYMGSPLPLGYFFPSLSLTGDLGKQSSHVNSVLKGTDTIWSYGASLTGPIFTGGQLTGEYEAQIAQWKQAKTAYEQTVLNALAEVSNALILQQKLGEIRPQREQAVRALQASVDLSLDRYLLGLASYFEVLQVEEQLYAAQQELVQTQVDQLNSLVQLYRALGGGWRQQETPDSAAASSPAAPPVVQKSSKTETLPEMRLPQSWLTQATARRTDNSNRISS